MNRRNVLCSALALLSARALAQTAPIAAISVYERDSGGHIGLYAENLRTGVKVIWRADQRFVMCSTFKASLAACVLARVDRGLSRLDEVIAYGPGDLLEYAPVAKQNVGKGGMSVDDMCRAVVELSDNTCANALLVHVGGPSALTAFWLSIGDSASRLDHKEPELNFAPAGDLHDTTTPAAMAGNLRSLVLGNVLSPESRERLTGWLLNCKTGDHRLRAGLPKSWRVGDKTGNNGNDAAGDIAVTWSARGEPIIVCAYTRGGSPTPDQIETVFAGIGRFVGVNLSTEV